MREKRIDLIDINNEYILDFPKIQEIYGYNNRPYNLNFIQNLNNFLWPKKNESFDNDYRELDIVYKGDFITQSNENEIENKFISPDNIPSPFENINRQIPLNMPNNCLNTNLNPTSNTTYQILQPIEHFPQKRPIFKIIKKKTGRYTKDKSCNNDNPSVHTKFGDDNIIMKIKVSSSGNYFDLLNLMLETSENNQINCIKLKKIDPSIIKVHSKEDNEKLLRAKMSDIFSGNISKRFIYEDTLYNKKKIQFILKKGDAEIKNALNKTFLDTVDYYCSKRSDIYLFEKLKKLEDDIEEFEEKGETEEYIQKYIKIANNFEKTIKDIDPRKPRKKKNSDFIQEGII